VCHEVPHQADFDLSHSFNQASEVASGWFTNGSCIPFTPASTPCTLGNYVSYAINVSCAADAAAGIKFAQQYNIRLVIKNTGHEYVLEHWHLPVTTVRKQLNLD